jgi:hypothetical protein
LCSKLSSPRTVKPASTVAIFAALAAGLPTAAAKAVVAPGKHFGTGVGPWSTFGCAGGIIIAALTANYRDNRELAASEAWTCGPTFWVSPWESPRAKAAPVKARG